MFVFVCLCVCVCVYESKVALSNLLEKCEEREVQDQRRDFAQGGQKA